MRKGKGSLSHSGGGLRRSRSNSGAPAPPQCFALSFVCASLLARMHPHRWARRGSVVASLLPPLLASRRSVCVRSPSVVGFRRARRAPHSVRNSASASRPFCRSRITANNKKGSLLKYSASLRTAPSGGFWSTKNPFLGVRGGSPVGVHAGSEYRYKKRASRRVSMSI